MMGQGGCLLISMLQRARVEGEEGGGGREAPDVCVSTNTQR